MIIRTSHSPFPRQRGIALVVVMWILVLMMVLAAGYSTTVRTETRSAAFNLQAAQARAVAEAGVWLAIQDLGRTGPGDPWQAEGGKTDYSYRHGHVEVRIQDQAGLLDLNKVNPDLLQTFMDSMDIGVEESRQITGAILDWRDRDHLVSQPAGAEEPDYRFAGYPYGVKNGPFNSVEELRRVMGVNEAIFQKLSPDFTVHSQIPGINPDVATDTILMALFGMDPESIRLLRAGRDQTAGTAGQSAQAGSPPTVTRSTQGISFMITSTGTVNDTRVVLEVVICRGCSADSPYSILAWEEK